MNRAKKNLHEAFWSKVDRAEMGCWEWRGWISPDGYGIFNHSSVPTRGNVVPQEDGKAAK